MRYFLSPMINSLLEILICNKDNARNLHSFNSMLHFSESFLDTLSKDSAILSFGCFLTTFFSVDKMSSVVNSFLIDLSAGFVVSDATVILVAALDVLLVAFTPVLLLLAAD